MTDRIIPIEDLHRADLSGIGHAFDLSRDSSSSVFSAGAGFTDRYTVEPLLDGLGHLGMTSAGATPADISQMERHLYSEEVLFCAGAPIVLPVALAGASPQRDAVRALLIQPGQGIVLNRGVWHAPCLGHPEPAAYYWCADVDDSVDTTWVTLGDGPVRIAAAAVNHVE